MEGVSMVYTFDDAKARTGTRRSTSKSSPTAPSTPKAGWPPPCIKPPGNRSPRRARRRHLGALRTWNDFSELTIWRQESGKAQRAAGALHEGSGKVPRAADRRPGHRAVRPPAAGRPDLMAGRKSLTVYEGMTGMMENAFINVKNQSKTITADVEIPRAAPMASSLPGRPLRRVEPLREGRQAGVHLQLRGPSAVHGQLHRSACARQGDHQARVRLRRPRMGKGGIGTILVNGQKVAEGRIEHTNVASSRPMRAPMSGRMTGRR